VDSECPRCKWFDWSSGDDKEDASSVATLPYVEINGVVIVTLADGRKILSGNTFAFREQIKAASRAVGLAAAWEPAEKTWTVSAGADLSFLRPPPPAPKKRALPFRRACCPDARHEIDSVCPQGPMLIVCGAGLHQTRKDDYEGS
jgi:hypothetical protein